jgi:hypothetical protein
LQIQLKQGGSINPEMAVMLGFANGILGWRPLPVALAKHHQIPVFAGMTVKIALAKRSYKTGSWGWNARLAQPSIAGKTGSSSRPV